MINVLNILLLCIGIGIIIKYGLQAIWDILVICLVVWGLEYVLMII